MNLPAGRSALLVALYLLTSAATAHAECAWVLWDEPRWAGMAVRYGPSGDIRAKSSARRHAARPSKSQGEPGGKSIATGSSTTTRILALLSALD